MTIRLNGATVDGFVNGILHSDGTVRLVNSCLDGCTMTGADCREDAVIVGGKSITMGAHFTGATMCNADFTNAVCYQLDARGANLTNLSAVGTNFTCATLKGADLTGCNLDGADLSYLDARDITVHDGDAAAVIAAAEAKFN